MHPRIILKINLTGWIYTTGQAKISFVAYYWCFCDCLLTPTFEPHLPLQLLKLCIHLKQPAHVGVIWLTTWKRKYVGAGHQKNHSSSWIVWMDADENKEKTINLQSIFRGAQNIFMWNCWAQPWIVPGLDLNGATTKWQNSRTQQQFAFSMTHDSQCQDLSVWNTETLADIQITSDLFSFMTDDNIQSAFYATHVHVTILICATWEEINHTWVTCTVKTIEWATALILTKRWASWSANVSCEGNEEHEPPSTVSLCSVPARPAHPAHPLRTNKLELFSYLGRTLSRLLIIPVSKLYSIIYYF